MNTYFRLFIGHYKQLRARGNPFPWYYHTGYWAGFEFYKDYTDMKEQIQKYVAPDLSGFDKQIALQAEHQITVERHMEFVSEELALFKDEFKNIRNGIVDNTDMTRDTKHDLR